MSLLGIFTGLAGIVGAALWLIAIVTGGAAGEPKTIAIKDDRDEWGDWRYDR